jgi:hypothetical protein
MWKDKPDCYGDYDKTDKECVRCQERTDCSNLKTDALKFYSKNKIGNWFSKIGDNFEVIKNVGINIFL